MTKSYVLKALKIFGLEEMLKLSQAALKAKPMAMKKAAGAELIVWDDAPNTPPSPKTAEEDPKDNVLAFKKPSVKVTEMEEPVADPHAPEGKPDESASSFYSSEFLLWQRELTKDSSAPMTKKEAVKGYSKATEMYVVKTASHDGKEKIRFASTNGILVNKKQG